MPECITYIGIIPDFFYVFIFYECFEHLIDFECFVKVCDLDVARSSIFEIGTSGRKSRSSEFFARRMETSTVREYRRAFSGYRIVFCLCLENCFLEPLSLTLSHIYFYHSIV